MFNVEKITNSILVGNCLELLKQYPENSIDCTVTSPPYWGKRAYGTNYQVWDGDPKCKHKWEVTDKKSESKTCSKCGAWFGELGQEPKPEQYVEHLTQIFMEIYRATKPSGSLWLNIGDTYYSTEYGKHETLKDKDLAGTPWMLAFALRSKGWYLRNDIIWSKPNPMPRSIRDRCTESHEYIFFMTKQPNYFFDLDAIREPQKTKTYGASKIIGHNKDSKTFVTDEDGNRKQALRVSSTATQPNPLGRQKRDVWEVNVVSSTTSFKDLKSLSDDNNDDVHPAAYSEELILPCILAGCPKDGIVFDPFMGSGTTAVVARKNGRNYSGTEISDKFKEFAEKRIATIDMDKVNGNNVLKDLLGL